MCSGRRISRRVRCAPAQTGRVQRRRGPTAAFCGFQGLPGEWETVNDRSAESLEEREGWKTRAKAKGLLYCDSVNALQSFANSAHVAEKNGGAVRILARTLNAHNTAMTEYMAVNIASTCQRQRSQNTVTISAVSVISESMPNTAAVRQIQIFVNRRSFSSESSMLISSRRVRARAHTAPNMRLSGLRWRFICGSSRARVKRLCTRQCPLTARDAGEHSHPLHKSSAYLSRRWSLVLQQLYLLQA